MTTRVKICGLRREEDVRLAARSGADYLGFVFAEASARRVGVADLRDWLDEARGVAETVGVFRDAPVEEVLEAIEVLDLDFVQLHGQESGEEWKRLPVRMLETRHVSSEGVAGPRLAGAAWGHLVDPGAGEGRAFDWDLVGDLARRERLFLAGGLDASNVGEAIRRVRPFAVDVATGVERAPGVKDPEKLRAFLNAVKEADAT